MSLLQVTDLTVHFRNRPPVLEAAALSIKPGEVVGLTGPSGSGKTTLALAIVGLLPEDALVSGSIAFRGRELRALSERELRPIRGAGIGFVFQESALALNPLLTAGSQIVEVARAHERRGRDAAIDRAYAALQDVGFGLERQRIFDAYPHELSGGERQRILIAQAIVCRPSLVIADEPVSSLDAASRRQVLDLLAALKARLDVALLLIAHSGEVLDAIADRVVSLQAGRLSHARSRLPAAQAPRPVISSPTPREGASPIAEMIGVRRAYRRRTLFRHPRSVEALQGVDFAIDRGSSVGLVGPSGSGKSTLARCLAGLERVDGGEVRLNGTNITTLGDRALLPFRNQVQLIFQDAAAALNPRFTALEIVSEPMVIQATYTADRQRADVESAGHSWRSRRAVLSASERRERSAALLSQVGLSPDRLRARPGEFSGGERQRLAIARALAVDARLLIFDEAFSGLDAATRDRVVGLLAELQAARELTYLFISHDRDLLALVATEVAVMHGGLIVDRGDAARVLPHAHVGGASIGAADAAARVAPETMA